MQSSFHVHDVASHTRYEGCSDKVGAPLAVRCQPLADQHDGELDIPTVDLVRTDRCDVLDVKDI